MSGENILQSDLPEYLESNSDCLFLVDGNCNHGKNLHSDRLCRKYCFLQLPDWLKSHHGPLSDSETEKLIIQITKIE